MKRREFISLLGGAAAAWPLAARAQQPAMPVIGILRVNPKESELFAQPFRRDIRELDWEEERNIHQAANRAYIAIRWPTQSNFSNQEFSPAKK